MSHQPLIRVFALAVLLVPLLGACGGLLQSQKPEQHRWWLQPPDVSVPTMTPPVDLSLAVTVVPGLDSERILTLSPDRELNHFAGAMWADFLPEVLGSITQRALANSGGWAAVDLRATPGREGCGLAIEFSAFHASLGSDDRARSVEVGLSGRYRCQGQERMVTASTSRTVNGNQMGPLVAAFQAALNAALADLAAQLSRPAP